MAIWYYGTMRLSKNGMKIAPTMSMKTRMKEMMTAIAMKTISRMIMGSRLEQHPMRAKQCGAAFARPLRMREAQLGSGEKKLRQLRRPCGAAPRSRRIGLQAPCRPRLCHALVLIHRSIFLGVTTSPGESSLFAKPHIVRVLEPVRRQDRAHLRTESLLDCRRCDRIINVHDRCACGWACCRRAQCSCHSHNLCP